MSVILFSTPRPFEGLYSIIQFNAMTSWAKAGARVALFGDREHEGDAAISLAESLGFEIVPVRQRSERGVPLVSDLFQQAANMAEVSVYVNADIIVFDDVLPAIERAAGEFESALLVARRWNVQVLDYLAFEPDWQAALWDKVQQQGSKMVECAIDLFGMKGEVYQNRRPPDYVLGKYTWDNGLLGMARRRDIPVVDITPCCTIVHQSHAQLPWDDPDANTNRRVAAPLCGLKDSTHTLTAEGVVTGWKG